MVATMHLILVCGAYSKISLLITNLIKESTIYCYHTSKDLPKSLIQLIIVVVQSHLVLHSHYNAL